MKSKFALSFGIALIVVGIINFFLETNNVILFGISISAFIFSLLSILFATRVDEEKYEILYIIPLLVMLCFFCYGNELMEIDIINSIVNSRLTSALTFISFGISFASEYIVECNFKLLEKIRHLSLIIEMLNYTNLIQDAVIDYKKQLVDKKIIIDEASKSFLDRIEKLYKEKTKKSKMEDRLLSMKKDKYTIDDFDEVYTQETEILKIKTIPPKRKTKGKKNK